MLARMKELKSEKERIATELEREEEMLVNSFRRRLQEEGRELLPPAADEGKRLDDN